MRRRVLSVLTVTSAVALAAAGTAAAAPSGPEGPSNCAFNNGATTCSAVGAPVVTQTTSSPAAGCTTTTTTSTVTTTYTRHRGTYNSNGKALDAPADSAAATSSASTSCAPVKYEAEDVSATGTFANGYNGGTAPDGSFSGDAYAVFRFAPGGTFTASISVPVDGTYDLTSGDCASSDTGIYTLSVDGSTVGSPTDTYNGTSAYCTGQGPVVTDHGTIFLTAGTHQLTQTVTGTTSGGYTLAPDYFQLTLQG